ncbi:unnamed protein product [Ilex paraguariensis]|uniref:Ubiquitin-like protease family profile domain-containing protein n=1 Tax=Ilex paraguariensis TaxID=185542 RepID=A0ABC8R2M2_9AQUA
MGALTSYRKRGSDCFYKSPVLSPPNFDTHRRDTHVSKKPRFSQSMPESPNSPISSKITASRICRYPESVTRFQREVHAPTRTPKFRFAASSRATGVGVSQRENSADTMGNVLVSHYVKARKYALDSLRFFKKDKEVIEIDDDTVEDDDEVSEIENLEEGREVRSMVLENSSKETNGMVGNLQKLKWKGVECSSQPSGSSVVVDLSNVDLKVDSAGKMLDSLSVNWDTEFSDLPVHKKLHDYTEKRNDKLNSLQFQIGLWEKHRQTLSLSWPLQKPKEDVATEAFLPLTEEEKAEVARAFSNSNRRKVLVNHENSNIEITGEILQCLRPGAWLNDEVINLYLELLKERENRGPKRFLKCHFFNTFFYKKLIGGKAGYDFKAVRRWTTQRKLGYCLLECDKIFVPIHKEVHWCLAVINKRDEKFQYLDSLGGSDTRVMKVLAKYFVDEVKDKSGKDIDVSSWKKEFVEDLPEQKNGFVEHMPYFRLRTVKEILRLKVE